MPSRTFALGDRGRIAPGQRADLLLVDGDPTTDITATRAIAAIWKNGTRVDRTPPDDAKSSAAIPADGLVADFDTGTIATRFGQNWIVTTDQLVGGRSTATQSWIADGAAGEGAMRVDGTVAADAPYPWAGTLFMPGAAPFEPVDLTGRSALVFRVRSGAPDPGRGLVAMVFSGPTANRMPSVVRFRPTAEWTVVRLPLAQFPGVDLARVRGLAFTAGAPVGHFAFEIDDVTIR